MVLLCWVVGIGILHSTVLYIYFVIKVTSHENPLGIPNILHRYRNELLLHTTQQLKICTESQKCTLLGATKPRLQKMHKPVLWGGGGGGENQACWAGSLLRSPPNPEVKPCASVGRLVNSIKRPSLEMHFLKIQSLSACARMDFTIFDWLSHYSN